MALSAREQIAELEREVAAHRAIADQHLSWWLSVREPSDIIAFDRAAEAQQSAQAKITKLELQADAMRRVCSGEAFKAT